MKMRIVFGGCRYYNNYDEFCKYADNYTDILKSKYDIIILSGHCSGVDTLAEKYAEQNNFKLEIFPAEWNKYGKAAGPIRNRKMVESADLIIAFWDYKSKGTKSLISLSEKYQKETIIVNIANN